MKLCEAKQDYIKFRKCGICGIESLMRPKSEKCLTLAKAMEVDVIKNHRIFDDDEIDYYFNMFWPESVCGYTNGSKAFQAKLKRNFVHLLEVLHLIGLERYE